MKCEPRADKGTSQVREGASRNLDKARSRKRPLEIWKERTSDYFYSVTSLVSAHKSEVRGELNSVGGKDFVLIGR